MYGVSHLHLHAALSQLMNWLCTIHTPNVPEEKYFSHHKVMIVYCPLFLSASWLYNYDLYLR